MGLKKGDRVLDKRYWTIGTISMDQTLGVAIVDWDDIVTITLNPYRVRAVRNLILISKNVLPFPHQGKVIKNN